MAQGFHLGRPVALDEEDVVLCGAALEARHLVVEEGEVTELPRGKKPVEFA